MKAYEMTCRSKAEGHIFHIEIKAKDMLHAVAAAMNGQCDQKKFEIMKVEAK
jgi:hypothetical protein